MAEKKYTRVREHIRITKKPKPKKDIFPIQRIVNAVVEGIIKGKRRKIS